MTLVETVKSLVTEAWFWFTLAVIAGTIIMFWHDAHKSPEEIQEEKEKADAIRAKYEAEKEARRKARTPVKTRLLDSGTTTSITSGGAVHALGRAAVGNFVAGPLGALAGAATTPSKVSEQREVAFKVWFEDGHTEVQILTLPDNRYKKYLELLEEGGQG